MTNAEDAERERRRRLLRSEEETDAVTPHRATGERPRVFTEPLSRPRVDADNMPLPRRVSEVDVEGTRLSPATVNRPSGPTRQSPLTRGTWSSRVTPGSTTKC